MNTFGTLRYALLLAFAHSFLTSLPCPAAGLPEIQVVAVKGGCFEMGDTFGDGGLDEKPVHQVCVDDFLIGKFEVTRAQWQAVTGDTPVSVESDGQYPATNVSWNDAQGFIKRLNEMSGQKWRLPTEAEWEYAARSGGMKQRFAGTDSSDDLDGYAWYEKNSGQKAHEVGTRKPNALGLYDMSGNVWEWCADRYDRDYYKQSPMSNPKGDPFGVNRIIRGGSTSATKGFQRASYRDYVAPGVRGELFGLRLALDKASPEK